MADATCSVDDCPKPSARRGWCAMHYLRWYRTGNVGGPEPLIAPRRPRQPPAPRPTAEERFWANVEKSETCWHWVGSKNRQGYGRASVDGKSWGAHRLAYTWLVGPIPEGLQLDHLCRVRNCVNPAHLEPVTQQENIRRGEAGQHYPRKTHCPQGHPYDEANTRVENGGGRKCRRCINARSLAAYYRRKQAS